MKLFEIYCDIFFFPLLYYLFDNINLEFYFSIKEENRTLIGNHISQMTSSSNSELV